MTRENVLFSIIGLLLGFIVGFIFTNTVNQRAAQQTTGTSANQNLPPDHPALNAGADAQALNQAAEEAARQAREAPEDFDAQMKAAQSLYEAARFDEAVEFLLQANKLRSDDYDVLVLLGNVNYEAGRFETAGRWYTAALLKRPDDINVRNDLGLTYFLRQPPEIERALAEFRRSLEQDPRHEQSLQNMVVALSRQGDAKGAEEMLARLTEVNPSNRFLPRLREEIEKARNAPAAGASPASGEKESGAGGASNRVSGKQGR